VYIIKILNLISKTEILKITILIDSETVSKFKPSKNQIFDNPLNSARVLSLNGRNHRYGYSNHVYE
jgi:hypothetical protein